MRLLYSVKTLLVASSLLSVFHVSAQTPSVVTTGVCQGVIADFNFNDNGFNSPSIYGGVFDSAFYFNASRGYWTDYMPPIRVNAPGFPRVQNIISPPYNNPNPNGTFTVGFYYIVPNPSVDVFQVRIVSVTQTPQGTVTNVEASSGVQSFAAWSTPVAYVDTGTALLNGFSGRVCIRLIDPDIVNATSTFRVEVTYLIHEPFFAAFDDLSIGPINSPLPVNFIGLVANRNADQSVDLKWDVTEEINVREYQVERSDNGVSFATVGSVMAKGKSIYSLNNAAPPGTVFYRVKSVDIDGRYKYSGVVRIKGTSATSFANDMSVYPVPASEQVTVEHKKLFRGAMITIVSSTGRIMKTIAPAMGSSHTMINVSGMTPGLYFVRLDDGKGGVQTTRLVKN